ncbi:MAG: NAD(P)-dependent oxidoreductase [Bacilli bacterium]
MKVLLTGASGSVGYETLKTLISHKHEVIALDLPSKKSKKRLKKYKNQVEVVYGSINDLSLMKSLISKVDAIIHLAAVIPPLADTNPSLAEHVNFYGTQTIVDAINSCLVKPFLIYTSSVSIYGDRIDNYWIKVGDPLIPSEGDYYAETKIAVEAMLKESNIPYTIFRLTGIMGHPKTDPLMFHMPLDTKLEIASTYDTALALVNALDKLPLLKGHIYNLGGGEKCRTTYREFLISMFKIYGLNIKYLKDIAFAEKNFHCGYFLDGDKLDDIVHFRRDTLETYYARVDKETRRITRFFSRILSRPIIYVLTNKSEPYVAKKKKQKNLIERFFKK